MTDRENQHSAGIQPPESGESRSKLAGVASSIAGAAGPVVSAARRPVDSFTTGARRMLNERAGARVRRVRSMGQQPLLNLWEIHPQAHRAGLRELGLLSVPVDRIRGTAVEGPAQRGGDFLPLRERRSADWRGRWQRILSAIDQLANLPPIELLRLGDEYWVVDGHNRVAAALYTGGVEIDAVVTDLRLPGMASQPVQRIAGVLDGSLDLRNAGEGRLTRTSVRPSDLGLLQPHTHAGDTPPDGETPAAGDPPSRPADGAPIE